MSHERIISADSHVTLLDDAILGHLPRRHHDAYRDAKVAFVQRLLEGKPQKKRRTEGGPPMPIVGQDRPWEAAGRPGEYDPHARLADMDIDRVDAEVLYCDVTCGAPYLDLPDGGRLAAFQAINSAAIDFASVDPKRLLPVYVIPIVDVDEGVAEVERVARAGARALMLPLYPQDLGLPGYYDRRYDRLLGAIQETGVPVSQHVNANGALFEVMAYDPTPAKGIFQSLPPVFMAEVIANWIVPGTLERFPRLKVVLVEAGLGWIPFFIGRLDTMKKRHGWDHYGMLKEPPSFYWHRQMAATFEEDEFGIRNRDAIGVGNLMWATDYPHPDSTWPHSQEVIHTHFDGVPLEETRLMIGGNAARMYGL